MPRFITVVEAQYKFYYNLELPKGLDPDIVRASTRSGLVAKEIVCENRFFGSFATIYLNAVKTPRYPEDHACVVTWYPSNGIASVFIYGDARVELKVERDGTIRIGHYSIHNNGAVTADNFQGPLVYRLYVHPALGSQYDPTETVFDGHYIHGAACYRYVDVYFTDP